MSALATVTLKSFNSKFTAKFYFPIYVTIADAGSDAGMKSKVSPYKIW